MDERITDVASSRSACHGILNVVAGLHRIGRDCDPLHDMLPILRTIAEAGARLAVCRNKGIRTALREETMRRLMTADCNAMRIRTEREKAVGTWYSEVAMSHRNSPAQGSRSTSSLHGDTRLAATRTWVGVQ